MFRAAFVSRSCTAPHEPHAHALEAVVARLRYAGRYRSGYDPVDPADDFDVPERGRWSVEIDRDGQRDLRYQFRDDCGAPAPTAAEQALRATITKAGPRLTRCLTDRKSVV